MKPPRDCLHVFRDDSCAYCQWQVALGRVAEFRDLMDQCASEFRSISLRSADDDTAQRAHEMVARIRILVPDQTGEGGSDG